jgi:hypothetical protein
MRHIRVQDGTTTWVAVCLTGITCLLAVVLIYSSGALNHQPSRAELARQEAAATQEATLESQWRPWVTSAENIALISACLAVPLGIGLGTIRLIRGTCVLWPSRDARKLRHARRGILLGAQRGADEQYTTHDDGGGIPRAGNHPMPTQPSYDLYVA